ncbi:thioesterase II family protein [Micromonospora foliorum]|uniref:thioesterase II family protein n=1 Tax=Micromonospora foliorum TaxID=2911210 RepID=UPI001EE8F996|nr:alpha/beta fold hydrolase [Micromonospora foliorum]MCG5436855.1 alpha/beta fold hydrolase [Micromonospora foliorum]
MATPPVVAVLSRNGVRMPPPTTATRPTGAAAWLSCAAPRPTARLRLVCLPYAGAGAGAYRPWSTLLGDDVEVWTAQLPGRERRLADPPLSTMADLAPPLVDAIVERVPPPYAIFGHSMGALIGYEVANRLLARGGPAPQRLVVSAARPPQDSAPVGSAYQLDDAALTRWLRELGGVSDEVLADAGLLALILPTVRADLAVVASYRPTTVTPLPLPVDAVAGADDPLISPDEMAGWAACTAAGFSLTVVPGGHLYLHDSPPPLARLLSGSPSAVGADVEGVTR